VEINGQAEPQPSDWGFVVGLLSQFQSESDVLIPAHRDERFGWGWFGPIPPPFPNGKGADRLMGVTVSQGDDWIEDGFSFSPLGETGEGLVWTSPRLRLLFGVTVCPFAKHPVGS